MLERTKVNNYVKQVEPSLPWGGRRRLGSAATVANMDTCHKKPEEKKLERLETAVFLLGTKTYKL
jgi:hypothetical protein